MVQIPANRGENTYKSNTSRENTVNNGASVGCSADFGFKMN